MNMSNKLLPLIARILLSLVFINSGIKKITSFESVSAKMYDSGITFQTDLFLAGAIFLLLVGSLLLITGYKSKVGAFMIVLFLVPTTIVFHWDFADPKQVGQLLKNAGLLGGLLMVLSYGTGDISFGKK
jgi:putative oxidoreductase